MRASSIRYTQIFDQPNPSLILEMVIAIPHTDTHRCQMGTKNIAISDEAYQRLRALKKPGESFTEVIERMTRRRGILELSGILSKHEASRVAEVVRETRSESSKRVRRTIEKLG